jgi:hypothetical protein
VIAVADSSGKPLFRAFTEVDFSEALGGTRMDLVQTYTLIDPSMAWMVAGAGWMAYHARQAGEGGRAPARRDRHRHPLGGA